MKWPGALSPAVSFRPLGLLKSLRRLFPVLAAAGENLAELHPRLVELRLGGADGAAEQARDLVVVVALDVVEDEGRAVAGRELRTRRTDASCLPPPQMKK